MHYKELGGSIGNWSHHNPISKGGPTSQLSECPICHSPDIDIVDEYHIRCNNCPQRGRIT
ncbi:MAG: hypothetical protein ACFE9L_11740 [Candidatus Hodarchaeota archaeon]